MSRPKSAVVKDIDIDFGKSDMDPPLVQPAHDKPLYNGFRVNMSSIDVKRYYVIPFRASMSRGGLDRQGHTGKRSVLTIVGEVHRYLPQWTATDHDRPQWAATDYNRLLWVRVKG